MIEAAGKAITAPASVVTPGVRAGVVVWGGAAHARVAAFEAGRAPDLRAVGRMEIELGAGGGAGAHASRKDVPR